jgi:hypothetical protein
VEYSRHGKVLKGEEQTTVRSRYEEDVLNNNHTAVWGSWWAGGIWGYKCCHSTIKNSYCTGTGTISMGRHPDKPVLRIRDVYPVSEFFHPGSWIQG